MSKFEWIINPLAANNASALTTCE